MFIRETYSCYRASYISPSSHPLSIEIEKIILWDVLVVRIASSWFLSPGACRRGVEATEVIVFSGVLYAPYNFVPENCMISESLIYLELGEPSHCNDVGRDSNAAFSDL